MGDSSTDSLRKTQNCLFVQRVEKGDFKKVFVALFNVFWMDIFGEGAKDLLILVKLKGLLDLIRFFDKVADFSFELLTYLIFFAHFMKVLKFFFFFLIVSFHLTDNGPYVVDIISKGDATEGFNKN